MKNRYLFILCFFVISISLKAQEYVLIDKDDIIAKVKENNLTLKISQEDIAKAKGRFTQANAIFLPSISASHTGFSTTNPLMAFGSKLNQAILTANDFNPVLLNNPQRTQNFATRIEMQQPLINLDGLYQRKAAKKTVEAMQLQKNRTEDYLILEIDKTFLELQLTYKALEVHKKSYIAIKETKRIIENKYKQGLLQKTAVLQVEVSLTEILNQINITKSTIENLSNYLSFLMNEKTFKIYKPSSPLEIKQANFSNISISENRGDIRANKLSVEAYEALNKAAKMSYLPRLNAFGSYELYDKNMFRGGANGYLIGASLSWDLFKGSKRMGKNQHSKAAYNKASIEYEKYVSKSKLELEKAKRTLADAKNNLTLSELAMEQSEEALRILKNRFKQGLEKTNDLLIAEATFAQKQLAYYNTIFQYNYLNSYTQFLIKE